MIELREWNKMSLEEKVEWLFYKLVVDPMIKNQPKKK